MPTVFDTINKMYVDKEKQWAETSNYEKGSAYFLLNRCMSMIHPILSAELSRIKICTFGVMEYWQSILSKHYLKSPGCFYQVSPKKKKEQVIKKTKTFIPELKTINYYCDVNNIDSETFKELQIRYSEKLNEELKEIQENI